MFKFFKKFEDLDQPLLGPSLKIFQILGLWQRKGFVSNFMFCFFIFGITFFVPSQYVELWFIRNDQEAAFRNITYSLGFSMCFVKSLTFILWKKKWAEIFDYVSDMQNQLRSVNDEKTKALVREYTKYSRMVTYFYCLFLNSAVVILVLVPIISQIHFSQEKSNNGTVPYTELMSSWVPFDKSKGLGYFLTFALQTVVYIWAGNILGAFDSIVLSLTTFFAGQLKILKLNCSRLFQKGHSTILTYGEILERIKDCHCRHINIVKHCKILDSLLTHVMFLFVSTTTFLICTAAISVTSEVSSLIHKITLAQYLLAAIIQLFIYSWHANEVFDQSLQVSYGVLESEWWTFKDVRVRRDIVLLCGQLQHEIVFTAGPFVNLGISNFIKILRGSYSYYTLLK